jgi:HSP20 family molecular chaperone IbpA
MSDDLNEMLGTDEDIELGDGGAPIIQNTSGFKMDKSDMEDIPRVPHGESVPVGSIQPPNGGDVPVNMPPPFAPGPAPTGNPYVEIITLPDSITMSIDVPGCQQDDITITYDDPSLTVIANRQNLADELTEKHGDTVEIKTQKRYGELKYEFKIQKSVEGIKATVKDGVLDVVLTIKNKGKPITVSVN